MNNKKDLIYKSDKSEFGITYLNNKKCFFKKLNDVKKEVDGYHLLFNNYNIPSLISYNDNYVYYEYKKDLFDNTLHDCYYNKYFYKVKYKKILDQYKYNLKNRIILSEEDIKNKNFFKMRIDKIDVLLDDIFTDKKIKYGSNTIYIRDILKEIKTYILEPKELVSFLTQGDPTDTNISANGIFTDFENAGYNSVVGEISICTASFLTHGCYFYPKYHQKAYLLRPKILKKYNRYKSNINYKIKDNIIDLENICFNIPNSNKIYLKRYLKLFRKNLKRKEIKEIDKYLKYYLLFRMLTPITLDKMEEEDKYFILCYLTYFYLSINSFDDLINII